MQLRIRYRVSVKLNTQNQFSSSPDETCRKLCVLTDLHILEQTITKLCFDQVQLDNLLVLFFFGITTV